LILLQDIYIYIYEYKYLYICVSLARAWLPAMYFDDYLAIVLPFAMGLLGDVAHEVRVTAASFLSDVVLEYGTDFGVCVMVRDVAAFEHERNYLYRRTTLDALRV
jgi:hypothetical protein